MVFVSVWPPEPVDWCLSADEQKAENVCLLKRVVGFNKSRRLLKKSEYDSVFANPKRWINSGFIVLYRANTIGHARLGLALSKKMIAHAHDRNRLKRLIRETFRQSALPAIDVIILAKKGVSDKPNSLILNMLKVVLDKLCEK